MHIHPFHAATATLIGLLLHAIYLWTRSLVAPMLLHAVYNFQTLMWSELLFRNSDGTGFDAHVSPALAMTALVAAVGIVLLLYRCRVRWVTADGEDWSPGFPSAEIPPAEAGALLASRRLGFVRPALVTVLYCVFLGVLCRQLWRF
jgi:hypothetical protein